MDYDTCQPLAMLFHPGAVSDIKIYPEILEDLKKRRILKKGDLILADKGYFSFKNYRIGLMDYKNRSFNPSKEEHPQRQSFQPI